MYSGGWKNGAQICIKDPIDSMKILYFDDARFGEPPTTLIGTVVRKGKKSIICDSYREYAEEIKKRVENKELGIVSIGVGDSLWSISEDAYGSGRHWVALATRNEMSLGRSNTIPIGFQIFVPRPSELYSSRDPAVLYRGSSLWREWVQAKTCDDGLRRVSWEELTSAHAAGARHSYQGERPRICVPK
jgi:hypothetical protein